MKNDVAVTWQILDSFKTFVSANYTGKIDYVVGILNGGGIPAIVAAKVLGVPIYLLHVKSYRGRKRGKVGIMNSLCPAEGYGSRILSIDDIFDSGETQKATLAFLRNRYSPAVRSVVLISKDIEKSSKMGVEYLVKAKKNQWYRFPWEHE